MKNKYEGMTTQSGHFAMQAVSAFQKSIRRALEANALYWAAELDRSGYSELLWTRILIITSEDAGMGCPPGAVADIRALYENWKLFQANSEKDGNLKLCIVHAIMILCRRCQKSRAVDNALLVVWSDTQRRELPDCSIDLHSKLGRSMGRHETHWIAEGSMLYVDPDLPPVEDPYQDRAERLLLERESKRQKGEL